MLIEVVSLTYLSIRTEPKGIWIDDIFCHFLFADFMLFLETAHVFLKGLHGILFFVSRRACCVV